VPESTLRALYLEEGKRDKAEEFFQRAAGIRLEKAGFGADLKETDYVVLKGIGCPAAKPKPFCDLHTGTSCSR
jgi:hypothetical protein